MFEAMSLFGGGGAGGTSISPDNSMHNSSESSGTFGDHNIGFGAGKNSTLILAGAAVLIAIVFFLKRR
jgi:hypothetical protein